MRDKARDAPSYRGTPAGVLVSTNGGLRWRFTALRKDVHGLSAENGKFFALSTERVVYGSDDGDTGTPVAP